MPVKSRKALASSSPDHHLRAYHQIITAVEKWTDGIPFGASCR